jgi:GT2 family glycosyltransferase
MKLSIILPSYQQGRYIGRTLRSIIEQRGDFDREIFVVDGGSTDETLEVIRKHESEIAWWRSHKDDGQTAAINEGLSHATGDVVAYINSDDYYLPGAFDVVASWWASRGDASPLWLAGACHVIEEGSNKTTDLPSRLPPKDPVILFGHPWCPPQPSCFWARELFQKLGPFDAGLKYVMDVEWSVRCAINGYAPKITGDFLSVRWEHAAAKSASKARFFLEMRPIVSAQEHLTNRQRAQAARLLENREKWETSAWSRCRAGRLIKDFLSYPPVVKHWLRRTRRNSI